MRLLSVMLLLLAGPLSAQSVSIDLLETEDGKKFENAVLKKRNEYEVSVMHDGGTGRIPIEDLPADVRKKLKYDPKKAEAAKGDVEKARIESERKIAENYMHLQKQKAWEMGIDETEAKDPSPAPASGVKPVVKAPVAPVGFSEKELLSIKQAVYIYSQLQDTGSVHFGLLRKYLDACKDPKILDNENWPLLAADASFNRLSISDKYSKSVPPNEFTEQKVNYGSSSNFSRNSRKMKESAKLKDGAFKNACAKAKGRLHALKKA